MWKTPRWAKWSDLCQTQQENDRGSRRLPQLTGFWRLPSFMVGDDEVDPF